MEFEVEYDLTDELKNSSLLLDYDSAYVYGVGYRNGKIVAVASMCALPEGGLEIIHVDGVTVNARNALLKYLQQTHDRILLIDLPDEPKELNSFKRLGFKKSGQKSEYALRTNLVWEGK
jgi:hypothetical protein